MASSQSPLELFFNVKTGQDEKAVCLVSPEDLAHHDIESVKAGLLMLLAHGIRKYGVCETASDATYLFFKKIREIALHFNIIRLHSGHGSTAEILKTHTTLMSGKVVDSRNMPTLLPAQQNDQCVRPVLPTDGGHLGAEFEIMCRVGYDGILSIEACVLIFDGEWAPLLPDSFQALEIPVVAIAGKVTDLSTQPGFNQPPPPPPPPPGPPPPPSAGPAPPPASGAALTRVVYSSNTVVRRAQEILWPHEIVCGSTAKQLEIMDTLRGYTQTARRFKEEKGLRRGSSIGTFGGTDRGTLGFAVQSQESQTTRFVTCAHVASIYPLPDDLLVPFKVPSESTITNITAPGNLDVLVQLAAALENEGEEDVEECQKLINLHNRLCGSTTCKKLGVDRLGFGEDWALVEAFTAFNTRDCWGEALLLRRAKASGVADADTASTLAGITDPVRGDRRRFFKDGSTTGWTEGSFFADQARKFLKGTTYGLDDYPMESSTGRNTVDNSMGRVTASRASSPVEGVHPDNVLTGCVVVYEIEVKKGDSGGTVVTLSDDRKGFLLAGMALSMVLWRGKVFLFAVSSSVLFRQINEETGEVWKLVV